MQMLEAAAILLVVTAAAAWLNQRWLRLPRETYDRLGAHRARHALGGWDATVRSLLDRAADPLPSEPAEAPCTP